MNDGERDDDDDIVITHEVAVVQTSKSKRPRIERSKKVSLTVPAQENSYNVW